MKACRLFLLVVGLCFGRSRCLLHRISLDRSANALCSDGTPAAYYRSPVDRAARAQGDFVIFLEGGGYCHDPAECDWRCRMAPHLCTSPTRDAIRGSGILSDDPGINPHFHRYFKVDLPYCTSDMFVGRRPGSVLTNGHNFLGRVVLAAMMRSLDADVRIGAARRILLGGSSAGGAGVAFNCEYLRGLLPRSEVVCVVDAAFFYPMSRPFRDEADCQSIDRVLERGGILWNAPEVARFPLAGWWAGIRAKLFIGIARYDEFGIESFCGNETSESDLAAWGAGVDRMSRRLQTGCPRVGLFMPGCIGHMMLNDDAAFGALPVGEERLTYSDALRNWVNGSGSIHVTDKCPTSDNVCLHYC